MRQIAKIVLLLAPVAISLTGCASKPAWLSKSGAQPSQNVGTSRTDRLLNVARKYEDEGKSDVAVRLYEHILAQDPECREAKQRLVAISPQKSGPKLDNSDVRMASKSETRPVRKVEPSQAQGKSESQARSAQELVAELKKLSPERKSSVSEILEETPDKRMNLIELTYESPEGAKASDLKAAFETKNSTGKSTEYKVSANSDADAASKIAQPISEEVIASASSDRVARPLPKLMTDSAADETAAKEFSPLVVSTKSDGESWNPGREWWDAEIVENPHAGRAKKPAMPKLASSSDEKPQIIPAGTSVKQQGEQHKSLEGIVAQAKAEWKATSVQRLCDESATPELIQVIALLDSQEPQARIAGLIELGTQGTDAAPATPAVRALLNDQNALVRAHAAGTVRDIEGANADVIEHLTLLLSEKDPGVLRLAAYLLGQMGEEAQPAVAELTRLRDHDRGLTQLHAAEALTRIVPGDPSSYETLKQALNSGERDCRLFAAVSLGGVSTQGEAIAAQALKEALGSQDAAVRASAALSLGGLGEHAEIALVELQHASDFDVPEVREAALTALACMGH